MKKNISINLQGMIFHIEEDGYEQLSQYLAAIKTYFSTYAGHEEITADIEARIAEIFYAKLSPVKQVITRDDVQALIAQMGSVKDFEVMEDEEDNKYDSTSASGFGQANSTYTNQDSTTYKRIYRDQKRKVISGVAAGIANYLKIDPLWTRLGFLFLTILFALPGGFPAGFIILAYIFCWIAFPESYSLPETNTRKLFRNPFDKKLGGVASGISLFFGTDVAVIRLLFLISVFLGGFGFIIYIVLWIILPEASSITDRVQMEGNPITLSSIEESLKNNLRMKDENGEESPLARVILFPVRVIAQVLQFLSRVLHPILNFLVAFIRIIAGVMLMVMAGALIFSLFAMAATALHIIDGSSLIHLGDIPLSLLTNSFPDFGMVAGFFTILLPALFLLMLGLGLLLKRFFMLPAVGWSMFGIWILSLFVLALAALDFSNDFRQSGEYVTQKTFPVSPYQTVILKSRNASSYSNGHTVIDLETYPGADIRLIQQFRAKGLTESEAIKNAQMVTYRSVQEDSVITLDYDFQYKPNAIYRDQELKLKLLLPENKRIRISDDLAWMLPSSAFEGDYHNSDKSEHVWQAKSNKLFCLDCPLPDTTQTPYNTEVNGTEEGEDSFVEDSFFDEEEYGNEIQTFDISNFENVKASGIYHIKIREGSSYSIRARGNEEDLEDLLLEKNGDELVIKPKKNRLGFSFSSKNPVFITIEMPTLREVDFDGAVKADIAGFNARDFEYAAAGAVEGVLNISAQNLQIDVTGACETTVIGNGTNLNIDAAGASEVKASNFKASLVNVDLAGACSAHVYATNELEASLAGPCNVTYRGNPQSVRKQTAGMGSIEQE